MLNKRKVKNWWLVSGINDIAPAGMSVSTDGCDLLASDNLYVTIVDHDKIVAMVYGDDEQISVAVGDYRDDADELYATVVVNIHARITSTRGL